MVSHERLHPEGTQHREEEKPLKNNDLFYLTNSKFRFVQHKAKIREWKVVLQKSSKREWST